MTSTTIPTPPATPALQHVLKGWCANIRWADKLINSDFIHTSKGHPIYFECTHRPWAKNPAIRQIIVRATNPRGNTIQLSVLSDGTQRPVHEIVRLMFNRWVQENDFKYLDKHFGINELTSYRSTPITWPDLRIRKNVLQDTIETREVVRALAP